MHRREFTRLLGLGAAALSANPLMAKVYRRTDPFRNSIVPIGLCNHSLRGMRMNARELLGFAVEAKLDSLMLNTFGPLESLKEDYLKDLKKYADDNGVSIYLGSGSISRLSGQYKDTYGSPQGLVKEGLRIAKLLGSPVLGCRIGSIKDRYVEGGIEAQMDEVIQVMRSERTRVLDSGIKLAFENHAGDLRSEELLRIIDETGKDICGALYDPGNAIWAMEDPMEALHTLGASIIATSIRDVRVWSVPEGAMFQWTAVGDGVMDYPSFINTMGAMCPGVPVHVETISNSQRPIPYKKKEFWEGFPGLQEEDYASFLKLVEAGEAMELMDFGSGERRNKGEIQDQLIEFSKSVDFLRRECGAGLKR